MPIQKKWAKRPEVSNYYTFTDNEFGRDLLLLF
jgi:hypothetical protein